MLSQDDQLPSPLKVSPAPQPSAKQQDLSANHLKVLDQGHRITKAPAASSVVTAGDAETVVMRADGKILQSALGHNSIIS